MKIKDIVAFFNTEDCQELKDTDDFRAETIGNKALNLIEMMGMGVPVPEGFVLPTKLTFSRPEHGYSSGANPIVKARAMTRFAAESVDKEWDSEATICPYIVSVRSGAPVSMPGMCDTILNVGLNDHNTELLATITNNPVAAFDSYRRLIEMIGTTVHEIDPKKFREMYSAAKEFYQEVDEVALRLIVRKYKEVFRDEAGYHFPQDVDEQLLLAINCVFASWNSERAVHYREKMGISDTLGTAVTIQGMRLGNFNETSGSGVLFTRNPNTGESGLYGDWAINVQGEDVVNGSCQPLTIAEMAHTPGFQDAFAKLSAYAIQLDNHHQDMVDIEFTVEDGKLWILQCRKGKRSTEAAVRIALSLFAEDKININTTVDRILETLSNGTAQPASTVVDTDDGEWSLVGTGCPAVHGIIEGRAAFTKEDVDACKKAQQPYIFIAAETSPHDTPLMSGAVGLLTGSGGLVSHAALCAREWGIPAVVGLTSMSLHVDNCDNFAWFEETGGANLLAGELVRINGKTGQVWVAST